MNNNFQQIVANAIFLADSDGWKVEINSLPSGKRGFIFMAVEDALRDLGGYMKFDGERFSSISSDNAFISRLTSSSGIDRSSLPNRRDWRIRAKAGYFMSQEIWHCWL